MRQGLVFIFVGMVGLTGCGRDAAEPSASRAADVPLAAPSNDSLVSASDKQQAPPSGPAQTQTDQAFPYRALRDLRRQSSISEAQFTAAHPDATCFSAMTGARVCELQKPPRELCPGAVDCSAVGYVFKDAKTVSARVTLSEAEFGLAYRATNDVLGDTADIQSHPVQGVCRSVQTATFDLPNGRLQFEYTDCGATAQAYGQQQAIIVALKAQPAN